MFRRSATRLVAELPSAVRYVKAQVIDESSISVLLDFPDDASFHKSRSGYLQNLYDSASPEDGFSKLLCYGEQKRLMVSAPVTLGCVTLRTPFLIDTGCFNTMLHTVAWDHFERCCNPKPDDVWPLATAKIGTHSISGIQNNTFTTTTVQKKSLDQNGKEINIEQRQPHLLGYLNILGMDFLTQAVPELTEFLSESISKYQPPINEIVVTDGSVAFPVSPKQPQVMYLKLAIKAYGMYALPAFNIKIRDPKDKTKFLHDEDELHAGVEYTYELPIA